jgi:hypothetical protein
MRADLLRWPSHPPFVNRPEIRLQHRAIYIPFPIVVLGLLRAIQAAGLTIRQPRRGYLEMDSHGGRWERQHLF